MKIALAFKLLKSAAGQEVLENRLQMLHSQKDPASANPDVEGQEEIAAEPVVEAEPEPGKSSHDAPQYDTSGFLFLKR